MLALSALARASKSQLYFATISIRWESKESPLWFQFEYRLPEATWLMLNTKKLLIG